MRKITDFIIDKRYLILVLFIILAVIAAIFSSKVVINYDLSKYLPKTSETRIGMDIMEKEFAGTQNSCLNLMFQDLKPEEKNDIYNDLSQIPGVDSVDYDDTENYNKENYTLYILQVDADEDSKTATDVYQAVTTKYEDYEFSTSGAISERNKTVLPLWIVGLAIGCALIILIVMCESYIEPFLFLFTILLAVLLNNGTNLIFDSVSNITNSITAILQLALSMDYSIMLMSRYNQEKENEKDNIKAMKNALHHAFTSISSSSVTTIVGLLALVFMSFTIGRDLGFVLAKGVLFSLISIFFVLPSLILMCDKWIVKTKKKSPHINLKGLGKLSFHFRYLAIFLFIGIFAFSYFLKGNLTILYTDSEENEISKVFAENNQIAIIYKNENESQVRPHLDALEAEPQIDEVLAYGNTIDEKLTYEELNQKLNDLGSDVNIEDYLFKLLYYHYYNQDETNTMTFEEFIHFIQTEVYDNETMNDKIDSDTKSNIDRLKNFCTESAILQKRTKSEIASILEINSSDVKDILTFYNSKHQNLTLSLKDFIDFMNRDVFTNQKYASSIENSAREDLNTLAKFTSPDTLSRKLSSPDMASLFGMDVNSIADLYKYYVSIGNIDARMTLTDFSNFVLNTVLLDTQYASQIDQATTDNIRTLHTFSNPAVITQKMNPAELANLFGLDESSCTSLLFFQYGNMETGSTLSLPEFIKQTIYLKNNTNYLANVDTSTLAQLAPFALNENNRNATKLSKQNLALLFNPIRTGFVENIYLLTGLPDDCQMTPQEFVNLVLKIVTPPSAESMDESMFTVDDTTLNQLKLLKLVIDDTISSSPTQYTATQLSQLLAISPTQMYQLFGFIDLTRNNTASWTLSPNDFVHLILANHTNEAIQNRIDEATMQKLGLLSNIMSSTLNQQTYDYHELANFIGMDENRIKSIYTLYMINTSSISMTPHEFVNFVLAHKDDATLAGRLSADTIKDLNLVQSVMVGVENRKTYSSQELSSLLGIGKDKMDLLYGLYVSTYTNPNQTISLKEFVAFLLNNVVPEPDYSDLFDADTKEKLETIQAIMNSAVSHTQYTKNEIFTILGVLTDSLDKNTIDLLYVYYGSMEEYDETWKMTVQEFVNFLNDKILNDTRFDDFLKDDMRQNMIDSKTTIQDAKDLLLGENYSRIVLNTKLPMESAETFDFIQMLKDKFHENIDEVYVIGNSPMAYEMSQTFNNELNFITVLTMIAIFVVVAFTFKSILVPLLLVFTIQCAVYLTMGILSLSGGSVYFIALLIVQSILMGATIDYAILYTSYYIENRKTFEVKEAIIHSYNQSIHTILTSASILVIVTLIVGHFSSAITAKICTTISQGTLCSSLIILLLLPAILGACDKIVMRKQK